MLEMDSIKYYKENLLKVDDLTVPFVNKFKTSP